MNAPGSSPRIRRFDEIDTDSDFELEVPQQKTVAPAVSFKAEKTDVHHLQQNQDSADSSLLFESLTEKRETRSRTPNSQKNISGSREVGSSKNEVLQSSESAAFVAPSVTPKEEVQTPQLETVVASPPAVALPIPVLEKGSVAKNIVPSKESVNVDSSEREAPHPEAAVPPQRQNDEPLHLTPSPVKSHSKTNTDLLLRARQRLEDKRRTDMYSTPHQGARLQGSLLESPEPLFPKSPRAQSSATPARQPSMASLSAEGVLRRLAAENNRLNDEVAFLTRENNRYRSAAQAIDSTDQMKLQITAEMLRKELLEKEDSFMEAIQNVSAERDDFAQQLQEAIEQSEGYAAAASQYEKLYNDKLKNLQSLSSKYQQVRQELDMVESKRTSIEKTHTERLHIEIQKTEKYKSLLHDAKEQRAHMQQLTAQLQQEVENLTRQCRDWQESASNAHEEGRRIQGACEERITELKREIEVLKDVASERQSTHAAELREECRLYDSLKQSLKRIAQEHKAESEGLRKTIEELRDEGKRSLREERQKRLEAEAKLQRIEISAQRAPKMSESSSGVVEDLENRLRGYRDDLTEARRQRDDAVRQLELVKDELSTAQDSFQFYQDEWQKMGEQLSHAEGRCEELERENKVLSSTVEELMHNDEVQALKIDELHKQIQHTRGASRTRNTISERRISADVEAQLLISENERLTEECNRLAIERSNLIEENGKIAAELLNWKTEMRQLMSSYNRSSRT